MGKSAGLVYHSGARVQKINVRTWPVNEYIPPRPVDLTKGGGVIVRLSRPVAFVFPCGPASAKCLLACKKEYIL